ncbi:hypothetical protein HX049_05095 [Myroides odoratimimus]|nr:hypothetical protein [Myroides odoratimimus]
MGITIKKELTGFYLNGGSEITSSHLIRSKYDEGKQIGRGDLFALQNSRIRYDNSHQIGSWLRPQSTHETLTP